MRRFETEHPIRRIPVKFRVNAGDQGSDRTTLGGWLIGCPFDDIPTPVDRIQTGSHPCEMIFLRSFAGHGQWRGYSSVPSSRSTPPSSRS